LTLGLWSKTLEEIATVVCDNNRQELILPCRSFPE